MRELGFLGEVSNLLFEMGYGGRFELLVPKAFLEKVNAQVAGICRYPTSLLGADKHHGFTYYGGCEITVRGKE